MKKNIPSTTELIKKHNSYIARFKNDKNFKKAHEKALKTLKHERLVHLIVTIAVTIFCLSFFALDLFFAMFMGTESEPALQFYEADQFFHILGYVAQLKLASILTGPFGNILQNLISSRINEPDTLQVKNL